MGRHLKHGVIFPIKIDFCRSPTLFVDGGHPCQGHPCQGKLGDCWLISACYAANQFGLIKSLFIDIPDFTCESGCFVTVRIYIPSRGWVEIRVDELLPTIDNSLVFASSTDNNHLWPAYIEKACAKYFGCYEALTGGQSSEAFIFLTNKYAHRITPSSGNSDKFLDILTKFLQHPSCIASITFHKIGKMEVLLDHYYVLEAVDSLNSKMTVINLQRSPNSCEYNKIDIDELHVGGFTITCMMTDLMVFGGAVSCNWMEHELNSSWDAMTSCGGKYGCSTYHQNPQFLLTITHHVPAIVHIVLIQQNKRKYRRGKQLQQAIGVHVWKISSQKREKLSGKMLETIRASRCTTPEYDYIADVVMTFPVGEGSNLVIIPSSHTSHITCSFTLKVVTSKPSSLTTLT